MVAPYMTHWFNVRKSYHFFLFLIIHIFLIFAFFTTLPIIAGFTVRLYIWPQIWQRFIFPPDVFRICLVCPSSYHSNPLPKSIFHQRSWLGGKYGVCPIYMIFERYGGWYFSILAADSFTCFLASLDPHNNSHVQSNTSYL